LSCGVLREYAVLASELQAQQDLRESRVLLVCGLAAVGRGDHYAGVFASRATGPMPPAARSR
jgi:hypothetical protein